MSLASRRLLALFGVSAMTLTTALAQGTAPGEGGGTALPPVTVSPPVARRPPPVRVAPAPAPAPARRAAVPQRPLGRISAAPTRPARTPAPAPAAAPAAPLTQPEAPVLAPVPLDEFSGTSTKTEAPAINTLGGASVVSQDQIRQVQPKSVSDLMAQIPGVSTQETSNSPAQSINIRGLQDFGRVAVLVDGARQNFQLSEHGANGTFFLDPALIGGIDVTRGPVSTIYGSGAIGGVVAFRTKGIDDILKPREVAGVEQTVGAGTNGYGFYTSTAAGFRLPDNAANVFGQFVLRDGYTYKDGNGNVIPDTGRELRAGNFKVNVNPAEGHQISATALLQKFDFTNSGDVATNYFQKSRFRNDVETSTYTLGYRYTPPDIPLIDLNVKGYYSTTAQQRTLLTGDTAGIYSGLGATPGSRLKVDLETTGFDVFNTSRFDTGPVSHALTVGGDGVFDHVRTTDNAGGFVGAFTPTGKRSLLGAFVQDEMRYGGWLRMVGAARYDSYSLEGRGYKSDGDRVSPRGTIGVSPLPWIEFYATYAEGYRAPTATEAFIGGIHPFPAFSILPNPTLRPETAHNIEGGVNLKADDVLTDGDKFRGKIVAFQNQIDNFINIQGVGPKRYYSPIAGFNPPQCGGTTPVVIPRQGVFCVIGVQDQQYVNIPKAELTGIEAEGAYDWGRGFVSAFYSHVDGKNKATGQTLLTISPDKFGGTFGLRFLDNRLTLGTRVTHYDARRFTNEYTDPNSPPPFPMTKAYTLVDVFASYEHNEWLRGDLTLANVGNVRYTRYLDIYASPGFQARGSLTVKFATR